MTRYSSLVLVAVAAACMKTAAPVITSAQPVGPVPSAALQAPAVGDMAPDFWLVPITSNGIEKPKKVSDYRGQTVVLWTFIRARTRG
jgi:hypothetical protein